jgi:hypothetical protein
MKNSKKKSTHKAAKLKEAKERELGASGNPNAWLAKARLRAGAVATSSSS